MKYCNIERMIASTAAIIFISFTMVACDSDDDNVLNSLSDDERSKIGFAIVEFTNGSIASVEEEREGGKNYYEVEWITPGGAIIEIELDRDNNCALLEAESEGGPFDYDFTPRMGLIKLSEAVAAAQTSQTGTLMDWELEQDDSSDQWVYEIEIEDAAGDEWEIEINAADATIISSEKS